VRSQNFLIRPFFPRFGKYEPASSFHVPPPKTNILAPRPLENKTSYFFGEETRALLFLSPRTFFTVWGKSWSPFKRKCLFHHGLWDLDSLPLRRGTSIAPLKAVAPPRLTFTLSISFPPSGRGKYIHLFRKDFPATSPPRSIERHPIPLREAGETSFKPFLLNSPLFDILANHWSQSVVFPL